MTPELQTLTTQVTESTTLMGSAVSLIDGLAAQIAALKGNPVALQALSDSLKNESSKIARAIITNTKAAHIA